MRNSRGFCVLGKALSTQGIRVVAPHLRGRGFSSWYTDAKDYHYDLIRKDVWDLLDHLQIDEIVILGTALGGILAIDMATANRETRPGRYARDIDLLSLDKLESLAAIHELLERTRC